MPSFSAHQKNTLFPDRPYQSVWRWLKKAGGALLVPAPVTPKRTPRPPGDFARDWQKSLNLWNCPLGAGSSFG